MLISQVCSTQRSVTSKLSRVFVSFLILLVFASAAFASTLVVPSGGSLQAAINSAVPGDTIVLDAGGTYTGPFTLPNKSGASYITIQSSRAGEISGRVTPGQSDLLARLRANVGGDPIIKTASGAHHYKLIGLDISTVAATDFIYDLVRLGDSNQTDLTTVPHHLTLDRLWIHGFSTQPVQRGISLNTTDTEIINCYISDIHRTDVDTQAIAAWNGPGPFQIINNYLEASGENVMFGGAIPAIPNLVASNIEIRRNYFFKPLTWKVGSPSYAGIHWAVKNLLEFKNARNITVDGNVFENCWTDAQIGYAVLFTVRSEQGLAPWATVENITFTNNTVKNTDQALQLLGTDYPYQSGRGNNLVIANNLFTGIANRFFTCNGFYNVTLNHNTHFQSGNVTALTGEPSIGFVYTNNITVRSGYGFFGDSSSEGIPALTAYTPGYVFQKNLIAGATASIYPPNNFYPASISGVLDSSYRVVNSTYKFAGTDGKDLGCDIDALNAAQSGGAPAPTATPTPTPSSTPPPTSSADVVLYAGQATTRAGTWTIVSDSSAAAGVRIWQPDAGAPKIITASASPANYFDMTFSADAGKPYRLWMRAKAQNDYWGNDSVFVQFSDSSTSSGSGIYRIGTTSATEVNLEDCSGCGLSGWGWQDNGWGVGVFGPQIFFQSTGTHTIRVQAREDGISIDQIVLSPGTYLNKSPGALKNDNTILPAANGSTPLSQTILLQDDFNDNSVDLTKWSRNNLFSGFTDSMLPASETGQRFQIGALLTGQSGSHYNGLRSARTYDFTGAYGSVEFAQAPSTATKADAMFTIGIDANNYYRLYVEQGTLICESKLAGAKRTLFTSAYNSVTDRFWRIRHDQSTGNVVFETAADNVNWIVRYNERWNAAVSLKSIIFELKAGTWQAESAPGTVVFDNFKAAVP